MPSLEFDTPAAPATGSKLEFDTPSKEEELRKKYLGEISQRGEPGYGERFIDSWTYGGMRPLSGLVRGVQGALTGDDSTFGERYRAGNQAAGDYLAKAEQNANDWGGTAADVAGSILAPFPAGKVAKAGTAAADAGRSLLAKLFVRGATQGGIEGAARNSEDVGSALSGAASGAALGGATSAVVGKAADLIPNPKTGWKSLTKGAEKEASDASRGATPQELRDAAQKGFKLLDNAGLSYGKPQTDTLKQGIDNLIATNQYNKVAHGKISGYVDDLINKASDPGGMKFTDLSNLRSALATEARGPDEGTRKASKAVIEEIDKLVANQPVPSSNPTGIDVKSLYDKARGLWRSAALADDVGWAANKAERKVATSSGVNPDEANRLAFGQIANKIDKPGAYNPYGDPGSDQRKMLARIVEGDWLQNRYRGLGNLAGSPTTRAVLGAGAAAAGFHGGLHPLVGALGGGAAAGNMVKNYFDRLAAGRGTENINALIRDITGSEARTPSEMAQRILLAKEAAKAAGGRVGGSFTGPAPQQQERLRVTRDAQ